MPGQLGAAPMGLNREQFAKFFRDEVAANLELVKIAKIRRNSAGEIARRANRARIRFRHARA